MRNEENRNLAASLDAIALFLAYPGDGTFGALGAAIDEAGLADAERERLEAFLEAARPLPLDEWQSLYTRGFDLDPACSLEVGWHVFGESYRRGTFLVTMRGLLRRFELDEGTDLPDHLRHVLRVLGRLELPEAALRAEHQVLPAIARMREALAAEGHPYLYVLEAAEAAVRRVCVVPAVAADMEATDGSV